MGMYDNIVGFTAPCVKCRAIISEWQSKDGECVLALLDYKEVSNFYVICRCGHWNEYTRVKATGPEEYKFIGEDVK